MSEMIPNEASHEENLFRKKEEIIMYRKKYYLANKEKLNRERCEKSKIAHLEITKRKKLQKVLREIDDGCITEDKIMDLLDNSSKAMIRDLIFKIKGIVNREYEKCL